MTGKGTVIFLLDTVNGLPLLNPTDRRPAPEQTTPTVATLSDLLSKPSGAAALAHKRSSLAFVFFSVESAMAEYKRYSVLMGVPYESGALVLAIVGEAYEDGIFTGYAPITILGSRRLKVSRRVEKRLRVAASLRERHARRAMHAVKNRRRR